MNKWLAAIRLPFLTASVIPVLVGVALAYYETGQFNWITALLTAIAAACLHTGANMSNDYYDHKTTDDDINETPTPFSGGSRVIQNGLLTPGTVISAALAFYGAGIIIGLYLWSATPGNLVLYLGLIGFLSGFLYTATPIKIGYHGWGELTVGLNFGILEVLGAYYVQTGNFAWSPVIAGIPVSFLIAAVLYINQFPDYEADKAVGKNHWVVKLGKKKARLWYNILMFGTYPVVVLGVIFGALSPFALIILATLPLAIKAARILKVHYDKIEELLPANALTIQVHLMFGLLLAVGFVAAKFLDHLI
ncbi:MAG: 1,4-dihydroxy-2-naphthoate octaprenyltransferase [candidate division Zixibacteria bacterium]|nr:1,4-dihydroxy-2-naphthoate octaprenyltransferase [candidate division Zixibacteria bacterium]